MILVLPILLLPSSSGRQDIADIWWMLIGSSRVLGLGMLQVFVLNFHNRVHILFLAENLSQLLLERSLARRRLLRLLRVDFCCGGSRLKWLGRVREVTVPCQEIVLGGSSQGILLLVSRDVAIYGGRAQPGAFASRRSAAFG